MRRGSIVGTDHPHSGRSAIPGEQPPAGRPDARVSRPVLAVPTDRLGFGPPDRDSDLGGSRQAYANKGGIRRRVGARCFSHVC